MDKPKRGYKQPGMSFGEGTGGIDFSRGRTGAYSTADGKLMSGNRHGGELGTDMLGNTRDTEMGRLNKEGTSQEIFNPYSSDAYDHERGTALVHGKTMDDSSHKSLYGVGADEPKVGSGMPSVNVSPKGNNSVDNDADIGNYDQKASPTALKAARSKASWGGGSLSKRQKIRLGKGGRKAERQLARIERKAARKKRRGRSV